MTEPTNLEDRWEARRNEAIGAWCVQPAAAPPAHEGGEVVADLMDEPYARHVAEVHNLWLDVQNTDVIGMKKPPEEVDE